ncbi:FxsB family cyclophane-forming radical SAM/SPASM peptide maturase [Streptomyces sp. BRA346]|uniref:FxsB family cyclophane-forming radical SAM/SPASM peptide maturase n=1 Tax=Streptomyces sp. BRA346 TaxID=2878199 RepID=UPI004063FB4C
MTRPEDATPLRSFILKVANRCNIDCDYCYVFNSKDQTSRHLPARMSLDVAQAAARRIGEHAATHGLREVHVVLHGGEPLLVGPRHMGDLLRTLRDGVPAETDVRFELQTNGTLLSAAWLDLFERYEVVVGVSLDGPPAANDRHRLSHTGRSSVLSAVRGIELLRSRPHLFAGLLAVVDLANDPVEVHDYLASFEPPVIDFNLPHGTHDDPPHRDDPALPEYGMWMSRVWDAWLARPQYRHSVRMLEDIVALSSGVRGSVETLGLTPPAGVVIESNGTIEGVDTLRSVEEGASWLGIDLLNQSFDQTMHHPKLRHRHDGKAALADQCQDCPLVEVCGGGYLPHRYSAARGYRNPSVYCADLEYLIRHVQGSLREYGWSTYAPGRTATVGARVEASE